MKRSRRRSYARNHCPAVQCVTLEERILPAQFVPVTEYEGYAMIVRQADDAALLQIRGFGHDSIQRLNNETGVLGPLQQIPSSANVFASSDLNTVAVMSAPYSQTQHILALYRYNDLSGLYEQSAVYNVPQTVYGIPQGQYCTSFGCYVSFRNESNENYEYRTAFFPSDPSAEIRWFEELNGGFFQLPDSPIISTEANELWQVSETGDAPHLVRNHWARSVALIGNLLYIVNNSHPFARLDVLNTTTGTETTIAIQPIATSFQLEADHGGPGGTAVFVAKSSTATTLITTNGTPDGTHILPALTHQNTASTDYSSPVGLLSDSKAVISLAGRTLVTQDLVTGTSQVIGDTNPYGYDLNLVWRPEFHLINDDLWFIGADGDGLLSLYRTDGHTVQQAGPGWPERSQQVFGVRLGDSAGILSIYSESLIVPGHQSSLFRLDENQADPIPGPNAINTTVEHMSESSVRVDWEPVNDAMLYQVSTSRWHEGQQQTPGLASLYDLTSTSQTEAVIPVGDNGAYGWHLFAVRAVFADGTSSQWSTRTVSLSLPSELLVDPVILRHSGELRLVYSTYTVGNLGIRMIETESGNGGVVFDEDKFIRYQSNVTPSPFADSSQDYYYYYTLPELPDGSYRVVLSQQYVDNVPDTLDLSLPSLEQDLLITFRNGEVVPNPEFLTATNNSGSVNFHWNGSLIDGEDGFTLWVDDRTRGIPRVIHQNVRMHEYTASDLPNGDYRAWVGRKDPSTGRTHWSPAADFRVANPLTVTAPGRSTTDPRPAFKWSGGLEGTYEVWLNNLSTGQRVARETVQGLQSWQPSADLVPGRYAFWVREVFASGPGPWSSAYVFEQTPPPVQITGGLQPGIDQTPVLSWNTLPDSASFELWISRKGQGAAIYRVKDLIEPLHRVATPLGNGNFTVWVRSWSTSGIGSAWGPGHNMTIGAPVTTQITGDVISWQSVTAATQYELWMDYLGGSQAPQSAYIHLTSHTTNSWVLPASLPGGRYRIWVRALRAESGDVYRSQWSNPLTITIALNRP